MKKLFTLLTTVLCLAQVIAQTSSIEAPDYMLRIDALKSISDLPVLPWLKQGSQGWKSGKPTFEIKDNKSELAAKGWLGMTDENLLLKIEVTDDQHLNTEELSDIWNGDAIQVGIDPEGQGAGEMPIETPGMVGSDDAGLGFGIGKNGPEGFAWFLGSNWVSVPVDKSIYKITRNEKKKLTIYELTIPWKLLKTKPGVHPHMGIAIQVNDNDPERKEQNRLYWGKGAGGAPTPGLFEKLAYSSPQGPLVYAYKSDQVAWTVGDKGEMCFTVASPDEHVLHVTCGEKNLIFTIPGSANLNASRYSVKLIAKDLSKPLSFEASLVSGNKKVLGDKVNIIIPDLVVNDFFKRIDSLSNMPDIHPLFQRHLNSLKALVMAEWGKMNMYKNNPRAVSETFTLIYNINEGLKGGASKWETYLNNERSLTIAYVSKRDGTLQYYSLDLPKDWDAAKKYPLFMELHGSGNQNPLATLSSQLSPSASALDLKGYTSTKSYMQQQGIGYHVVPFGRGNTFYIDIGEIDVFEAFKDAHDNFKIDEDRRYLYGFSMGGGGTWTIGIRTPDLWAAIGIYAGGLWNEKPEVSLGKNLTYLPTFIWCGDKDFLYDFVAQMKKELNKYNVKPEIRITKGLDHKYPDSIQAPGLKWMMQFTRKRPDKFSFSADKDAHTGVWGISMNREEHISGLPSFDCSIEGQTIKIDSKGTAGLKINLGEEGLKMTGIVVVIWNGKKEYEGEAKEILLGKAVIDPWSLLRNK